MDPFERNRRKDAREWLLAVIFLGLLFIVVLPVAVVVIIEISQEAPVCVERGWCWRSPAGR